MKIKLILTAIIGICIILTSSCNYEPPPPSQQQVEQKAAEQNIKKLSKQTSLPTLGKSLERINIKKRLELFEDENKVSYIYLVSYGRIMAFHPVKGKISSGSKRLTTNQKLVNDRFSSNAQHTMESPSLDGTYGSSDLYIYFWTTDNTYIQWNGEYMLADKPLKLTQQPLMVREVK